MARVAGDFVALTGACVARGAGSLRFTNAGDRGAEGALRGASSTTASVSWTAVEGDPAKGVAVADEAAAEVAACRDAR